MKLLGWNCNGAFRRKYQALENFNADIWVVPESESPAYLLRHKSPLSSAQQLWCGQNQSKGLSVFAFNGCQISRADFFNPAYRHILPVNITTADKQKMLLIAVWASRVKDNSDWDYIGQLCHFMEHCYGSVCQGAFQRQWTEHFNSSTVTWNHDLTYNYQRVRVIHPSSGGELL